MTSKLFVLSCLLAVSQSHNVITNLRTPFISSRIIGGEDVTPGEFPHQVSLQVGLPPIAGFQHFCGGTILSEKWILTAGHCIDAVEELPKLIIFVVKAGKHDLSRTEDTQQTSIVASYYKHPKYPATGEPAPNDIALIKLQNPLRLNKRVKSIQLPEKDAEPTGDVILSGWGAVNNDTENPESPIILQTAKLPIVDRKTCNQAIKDVYKEEGETLDDDLVEESNICTGPLTGGTSACMGDSGGPLISKSADGKTEVVGVVSWGLVPCGRKGAPAVFVRVSSFIDWIKETMSQH